MNRKKKDRTCIQSIQNLNDTYNSRFVKDYSGMKSPHNFPKIMIVNADSKMMSAISIETDSEFERDKDNRMKFSLTLDF
jgi:hypothetical protein